MPAIQPQLTTAGIAAVVNAQGNGLQAEIAEIAFGDAAYTPTATATALQSEKARVAIGNDSQNLGAGRIHVTAVEDGNVDYVMREVGFFLADGTLLAVYSHASDVLQHKTADVDALFTFDLNLSALPPNSVTVNGTAGINLPASTTTKRGMIELATIAEAVLGEDGVRALTPKSGKALAEDMDYQVLALVVDNGTRYIEQHGEVLNLKTKVAALEQLHNT